MVFISSVLLVSAVVSLAWVASKYLEYRLDTKRMQKDINEVEDEI